MATMLMILADPGMPEIKQIELYKKWRPLIPRAWRNNTCPKPKPEVLKRLADETNAKNRERYKAKAKARAKTKVVEGAISTSGKKRKMTTTTRNMFFLCSSLEYGLPNYLSYASIIVAYLPLAYSVLKSISLRLRPMDLVVHTVTFSCSSISSFVSS